MKKINEKAFNKSLQVLKNCSGEHGFFASSTKRHNYKRIWARDGAIVSLAALLTDDSDLHETVFKTLNTLKKYQGPHGEIPSNIEPTSPKISFGGTTGRVDSNLWFIIACYAFWKKFKDKSFLLEFMPTIERIIFLLGSWEYNNKGLLYIPATGDWSDEYIQHGYVLYDQLLYYKALLSISEMYGNIDKNKSDIIVKKSQRLKSLIRNNFWFHNSKPKSSKAYHPIMYQKAWETSMQKSPWPYWMSFFSPIGYGYRFDGFANVLAALFSVADLKRANLTDKYISEEIVGDNIALLPAFFPVITDVDEQWKDLQTSFSFTFKNKPYEYHNGGLWPMITGFYVVYLAKNNKLKEAKKFSDGIDQANAMGKNASKWGFYEFVNSKTFEPGGKKNQCWSASAAVMATYALEGKYIL